MPALATASGRLTVPGPASEMVMQASVVAIEGRALAIRGPVGSGKSTLALALIDRGAHLIGDDAATLHRDAERIIASPPPNIAGLIEVRGIGLVEMPIGGSVPLSLILDLGQAAERLPETIPQHDILGLNVPCLNFEPGSIAPALRAEWALRQHGL